VTYLDDFARALVTLGEREEALGHVWHVPNREAVPMRRFIEMVFAAAGNLPHIRAIERMFERVINEHIAGEQVAKATELLRAAVGGLDPEVLEGASAIKLVEAFAEAERLGAAGKALAARRVADSGAWRTSGEKSAAHWMAAATKTSVGAAVTTLETAGRLSELPRTEAAVRAGRLSEAQAKEVASAGAACPSSEGELLDTAATESVAGLRERCAQIRAAALSDERERYHRIHARRRLRHWSDPDGAFRLDALLTPDGGAAVLAALEPVTEAIFKEARQAGRREPYEAYKADALVAVAAHSRDCDAAPERSGPAALVHVVVDHGALTRGSVRAGETCEIPGVGPIPAATAGALASDAILAALVADGSDVTKVCNLGRTIPARLRSALMARDRKCVVPGCDARHHLQIDHIRPLSEGGLTRLANLSRLCPYHHYLKTGLSPRRLPRGVGVAPPWEASIGRRAGRARMIHTRWRRRWTSVQVVTTVTLTPN